MTADAGAPSCAEPEIVLDLSRLVSRILHRTPTGVDRVELAYARGLIERVPERLRFGAVHPIGVYGRISTRAAETFLDRVEALWSGDVERGKTHWIETAAALIAVRPRPVPTRRRRRVFVQSSPHHLTDELLVRRILAREGARFVCLLHDLIPITHPEYARPGGAALHERRIGTIARNADAVIANSQATLDSFTPYLGAAGRVVPCRVAHLGLPPARATIRGAIGGRPYFVFLGTIEPRKNHLLLLNLWRDLAERFGPSAVPRLLVIGRRGWENEQVVDMLERCPALRDCVEEHAEVPDARLADLLGHACALLLPSFAEGFGMPVPEALALGVPVICSDLPALREAGGAVPDYLDPLDGPAWRDHILAYADPRSGRRDAQIARMADWRPATWQEHIANVVDLVHRVAS